MGMTAFANALSISEALTRVGIPGFLCAERWLPDHTINDHPCLSTEESFG